MLYSFTLQHASRYRPGQTAILDTRETLTYRQLEQRVAQISASIHGHGLGVGDRLAILLPNCPLFAKVVYACLRLGVIAVPLNTRYTVAEIDAVLGDCQPKGIIRDSSLPSPTVPVGWDHVADAGDDLGSGGTSGLPPVFYDRDAVAGLFYTSGTTGKAKGVMLTHTNLLSTVQVLMGVRTLAAESCYLHAAPMFHLADFPSMLGIAAVGGRQAMIPRFELEAFCTAVQTYQATNTILIPTMINFLTLYRELGSFDLSSLQTITYGGSPIAPDVLERARKKFPGVRFQQGYGLTEASPLLTLLLDEDHVPERLQSCGRPPVSVELRLVDVDGNDVAPGEAGEVIARGPNIMKGYWNQPEETARAIRDGWLHTGDIAQQDAEGFFYIVDRAKDMIVTGGENVYSTEVESVLYAHPSIKEAAVIGIPDPQWGEMVTACVVLREGDGTAAVTEEDVMQHCRERLANYKIPRRVEFYGQELPKSGTGKILKRALREPFWAGKARGVA